MINFKTTDLFLVTGGNSGIGKSIALKLNSLGAKVIICGRDKEKAINTVDSASQKDNIVYELYDFKEQISEIPEFIRKITDKYGPLKGMILSAGTQYTLPITAEKLEKSKELFDINYFSNIELIKQYSKRNNNQGDGSSVVAISSFTSKLGIPGINSYSASKAALNSSIKTIAIELAKKKIRLNSILAGHVKTELLTGNLSKSILDNLEKKYPLGFGEPEDVANLACFLLSDKARWITGSEYLIDGGASINF